MMGGDGATWAMNGMAMTGDGQPDMPPIFTIERGKSCVLAVRNESIQRPDMHRIPKQTRLLYQPAENGATPPHEGYFSRYALTENGISPVSLPGHATLNVALTDDGYRQRGGGGGGRGGRGLRVEWMLYRGPALVAFEPRISPAPAPTGGKVSTTVSFTAPGTYVLRAKAIDVGGMEINKDVTVSVK